MDPDDARAILSAIEIMDIIRGNADLVSLETESAARKNARRSVVSACRIPKGCVITKEMLTFKRPGTGISPERMDEIAGCVAAIDIEDDTILQENMFINGK